MENMNLFQKLWQNWAPTIHSQEYTDDLPWINELNQAALAQLEKRWPSHIQLRVPTTPVCGYRVRNNRPIDIWNSDGFDRCTAMMATHRLIIPEGEFEKRVELATELLLMHIDQPMVKTAFLYWPIVPECVELHDGSPNRKYFKVRLQTTPNAAVDAADGNT